ncbi:MAG: type IV toxin-antitoxin system AbiEi family antitoxin domain-containing protein [Bacteroidetes bacterium]|nr:type IV toxin-antitoxin system AbiEi family antitoxin domain-containing protein [Bacteroidota bacterium]
MASTRENAISSKGRAIVTFKKNGGILRTAEAIRKGIHPETLYSLLREGKLERLSRGVLRIADGHPLSNPDLVKVAKRIPTGVICLLSALSFHDLTTHVPHEVDVALPFGAEQPRLQHPPFRAYRFRGKSFTEGIETHSIDGVQVRIYSAEKTLADCFKFRNKIGINTAVEALRMYRQRGKIKSNELMKFAAICRVKDVMRPYLEAIF